MELAFHKLEGAGNDYVFVDAIAQRFPIERAAELARSWSDRHRGIGADGLILLLPGTGGCDVAMRMWNADGSEGAMCGNGLRCLAALAQRLGHARGPGAIRVATPAGERSVVLGPMGPGGIARSALADLGVVTVGATRSLAVAGRTLDVVAVDAGNPHAVVFVAHDLDAHPVAELGAALQAHAAFPGGVNVEFVHATPQGLWCRVFERGSGETLACGTGAAAAALAARVTGRFAGHPVPVHMRGGTLLVHDEGHRIVLEGPVRHVYRGTIALAASAAHPAQSSAGPCAMEP